MVEKLDSKIQENTTKMKIWKITTVKFKCNTIMYWLYVITFCLIAWLLVVEHISKVRQPLPNFEAIYILTPEETVSHSIYNVSA